MNDRDERSAEDLTRSADKAHRCACLAQRELFSLIAEVDRRSLWRDSGARDMAHWLWMRYGISHWKACRWIAAAHALEHLPLTAKAFSSGRLGIDKVVELTRFATAEDETDLIRWAENASCAAIRHKGDVAGRQSIDEARAVDESRTVSWWYYDEGKRFGLEADLPALQGAVVARALDRLARRIPVMPGEEDEFFIAARRADALVALASVRISQDPDLDRATVVLHASVDALASADRGVEIEGGGVAHAETARRLACDARLQTVIEDGAGDPITLGRTRREPTAWMVRQQRYRDHGCTFPGCGSRLFTHAHHIVWWDRGGRTDLDNLILVCTFHHRLVHEYGWSVKRDRDGTMRWFHPNGKRYRAGPAPPASELQRQPELSVASF